MLIIEHRVNTRAHLDRTPLEYGVEIDMRDVGNEIQLVHDPFKTGESVEDFLSNFKHAQIVLNVKCDGMESDILELLKKYQINNYFFLDVANPTLVKLVQKEEQNIAVRFSEFEPIEMALEFAGKVNWVWVDCFNDLPFNDENYEQLKKHFKICIVSPELQNHPRSRIKEFKTCLERYPVDAVCTDFPEDWRS